MTDRDPWRVLHEDLARRDAERRVRSREKAAAARERRREAGLVSLTVSVPAARKPFVAHFVAELLAYLDARDGPDGAKLDLAQEMRGWVETWKARKGGGSRAEG